MSGVLILSALASAKDTAGTVLNPMIKGVNLVSVINDPIVAQYSGAQGFAVIGIWIVALALLGVLAWAVMRSKAPAPAVTEAKEATVAARKRKQAIYEKKLPTKSGAS